MRKQYDEFAAKFGSVDCRPLTAHLMRDAEQRAACTVEFRGACEKRRLVAGKDHRVVPIGIAKTTNKGNLMAAVSADALRSPIIPFRSLIGRLRIRIICRGPP